MPRRKEKQEPFGQRLARLRKARGLTQVALARTIGLSARMMAYYEVESPRPPAQLLPKIAKALGVTVDALLGVDRLPSEPPVVNPRLWRRMQRIEQLPPGARKAVLKVIDAYLAQHTGKR